MTLPTAGDVVPDIREPGRHTAEDLRYLVLDVVGTVDGVVAGLTEADEIRADPVALAEVFGARNRLWSELRLRGRLRTLCPHCRDREATFSLSTPALVLMAAPPPIFTADGMFPAIPVLTDPRPRGARRTDEPRAARLRVELPSGGEAELRDVDAESDDGVDLEELAWERWAPPERPPPADHAHWRRASPGFRAILRMSVALRSLDGHQDVSPGMVEGLSIADFGFLDACYYLTHYADQPRPDAMVVTCAGCGGRYLALS